MKKLNLYTNLSNIDNGYKILNSHKNEYLVQRLIEKLKKTNCVFDLEFSHICTLNGLYPDTDNKNKLDIFDFMIKFNSK